MKRPSKGELELLSLLWDRGAISLSEAHEHLAGGIAYTTVQTRLNRLVDKGLATRQKVGRQPTKYSAAIEPDEINASQLDALVNRIAGGSVMPLVAHLVQKNEFTTSELSELKSLVRAAEKRSKGDSHELH